MRLLERHADSARRGRAQTKVQGASCKFHTEPPATRRSVNVPLPAPTLGSSAPLGPHSQLSHKFPFPGTGLRLVRDQIHFSVSLSRSGPAFNKADAWAATSRRRRPAGSARSPPALPAHAHAHTPARARPAARQLGIPVLRRKPRGYSRSPGRPAAPSHHEVRAFPASALRLRRPLFQAGVFLLFRCQRSAAALQGAEPLEPCGRASCSERSLRALCASRASGVEPGGGRMTPHASRESRPSRASAVGTVGSGQPGDAPREPVPSLRLFSAAAVTTVLGCRPAPGPFRGGFYVARVS